MEVPAELSGEWFVNKLGTYWLASAQLYSSRQAAALFRILYAVFPWVDWAYVFVDDFALLLRAKNAPIFAVGICLLLFEPGVPPGWKKTRLVEVYTWRGYVINPQGLLCPLSQYFLILTF